MSFKYGHTSRYGQILSGPMRLRTSVFIGIWLTTSVLKFVSIRIPQCYIGSDLDVGMYVPTAESAQQYECLRGSVRFNSVTYFPESPTSWE